MRPGVRYMLASALAFSVMSVLVKLAGERLPSQEIVLARAVVSLVLSYGFLARAGISPWGTHRRLLLLRGFFGFAGLSCVFYSLTHLPLAEATVIQYMHPLFTALLAALVLGEAAGIGLLASIALSLAGLVLASRPSFLFGGASASLEPVALAAAVGGAFFSACAYVVVRRLSAHERPLVIVFYFPLVTAPASLPAVLPVAVWPSGWEWVWLLGVGVFTQLGQVALTRGMQHEPAGRATAISYVQILFAAVWGVLFFGERPGVSALVGATLILSGTLLAIRTGR